jgi:predicted nucleic acid-binding protein
VTAIILDSSVALSWCFEDEASPEMDAIYERVRDEGGIVPGLWHVEVGNVLVQAERRGRISAAAVAARLESLAQLPISVDIEAPARAWGAIVLLARTEGLTTYDATYLDLAMRLGLPLATNDRALADAARRAAVPVLP